jgi:hypothetical protein
MTHRLEGREAPQAAAMGAIGSSSGAPEAVHFRRARANGVGRQVTDQWLMLPDGGAPRRRGRAREGTHGVQLATLGSLGLGGLVQARDSTALRCVYRLDRSWPSSAGIAASANIRR